MTKLYYSDDHIWYDPQTGYIGLSPFLMAQLEQIVEIQVCPEKSVLEIGHIFSTIESLKTVHELLSPVKTTVLAYNPTLKNPQEWQKLKHPQTWIIQGEKYLDVSHLKEEERTL